jgi:hypothetical protein
MGGQGAVPVDITWLVSRAGATSSVASLKFPCPLGVSDPTTEPERPLEHGLALSSRTTTCGYFTGERSAFADIAAAVASLA